MPTQVHLVQHPPLICAHCGSLQDRSVVCSEPGIGEPTLCMACGKGIVLDGPIFATACGMLDPRIPPRLALIRQVLVQQGVLEAPRVVGVRS